MTKPAPHLTLIGVAPPRAGSAPKPTRSLTPTGRYRFVEEKHPATEAARELGKVFEGLALALEKGHVEDENVTCISVACDEFFAAYRAMKGV